MSINSNLANRKPTMTVLSRADFELSEIMSGVDPRVFRPRGLGIPRLVSMSAVAAEMAGDKALADLLDEINALTDSTETSVMSAPATLVTTVDPAPALPPTAVSVPEREPLPRPAKTGAAYEFPAADTALSGTDLQKIIKDLTEQYRASKDYWVVRKSFCAVSIALDKQGLWAPRFRPQPKVIPARAKTPMMQALHQDHVVIDAHWLWTTRQHGFLPAGKYERLLDSSQPFDFALAALYAQENWKSEFRAEHLSLAHQVQWQLFTIKSKSHADAYRLLTDGDRSGETRTPASISRIKKAIATWAYSSHPICGQEQAYADLWLAREMLGAKGTMKDIAILAGLMGGHAPLDASTARHKLKGLNRQLGLA